MTEAHNQIKNGNVMKFLKNYWFIVVFIVATAVSWSEMRGMILQNIKDIDNQSTEIQQLAASMRTLSDTYIADITFIKTTLKTLK